MENITTTEGIIDEILTKHGELPERPSDELVEAAINEIIEVDEEEASKLEAISNKGNEVPAGLFSAYKELKEALIHYQSKEKKKKAVKLLDSEKKRQELAVLVQRAVQCVSSGKDDKGVLGSGVSDSASSKSSNVGISIQTSVDSAEKDKQIVPASSSSSLVPAVVDSTTTDSCKKIDKGVLVAGVSGSPSSESSSSQVMMHPMFRMGDSNARISIAGLDLEGISRSTSVPQSVESSTVIQTSVDSTIQTSVDSSGKLTMLGLERTIDKAAGKGTKDLILTNRLSDQITRLPDSIGNLKSVTTLDLSQNQILEIPNTIARLSSLSKLDLHANRFSAIHELPPSVGRLFCLTQLNLDSNKLTSIPDTIGLLVHLKKLSIQSNCLSKLPYTINHCSSLQELLLGHNMITELPETLLTIKSLEILCLRYNRVRYPPPIPVSLPKLREINLQFNNLATFPETWCDATALVKLDLSNNPTDLRALPNSIGNFQMLTSLDISETQITELPKSFGLLSNLTVLRQTRLVKPPRKITLQGAQAVVRYMGKGKEKKGLKNLLRSFSLSPTKKGEGSSGSCF